MEEEVYNVIITSETKINETIKHEYLTSILKNYDYQSKDIDSGINTLLSLGVIKRAEDDKYIFKKYK